MKLTTAEKRKIIFSMAKTPEGRVQLAASLQEPLRRFRDYESVGRRAFMIDELTDGQLPYYDKDPEVIAYVVAEEGNEPMSVERGERVFVPMREISSNPTIPITKIRERKFDIENRVKTKTRSEIVRKEDKLIFDMFHTIVNGSGFVNAPVTVSTSSATIDSFSSAMGLIERHGNIRCANIFMNPINMKIIRKIGKDYFDPVVTNELLRTGFMGTLFGSQVHTSSEIAVDEIYFTGEEEYFGVLPVGMDITVLSADDPTNRKIGFSVFEQVGFLVHNSTALSVVQLT